MTEAWQNQARCRQEDPGTMHPDAATHAEVAEALLVCEGCPVRDLCQLEAESHQAYGVWAGQWYGPHPVWEVVKVCAFEACGREFRTQAEGRASGSYCSAGCRVGAHRAVRAAALAAGGNLSA